MIYISGFVESNLCLEVIIDIGVELITFKGHKSRYNQFNYHINPDHIFITFEFFSVRTYKGGTSFRYSFVLGARLCSPHALVILIIPAEQQQQEQYHQSPLAKSTLPLATCHFLKLRSCSTGGADTHSSSGLLSKFICNFHTRTVHHINKQLDGRKTALALAAS